MDQDEEWTAIGQRIASHSDYFNQVIGMVPANVYAPRDANEDANPYLKHKNAQKSPKVARQKKANFELDADQEMEDEESGEESSDEGGTVLSGFGTSVLPESELKQRFNEKMGELRKKRKLEDEDSKQGREKRQKIDARRAADKSKKAKKPKNKTADKSNPSTPEKKLRTEGLGDTQSLEFASFATGSGAAVPEYLQNRQKKPSRAKLLQMAQENKKMLEAKKGTPEGQKMIEDQAWDTMMKKASGEKVKDDIQKLKKTVKREEAKKKKSKKEWDQRISLQKKSQADAQAKRKSNLEQRKQSKLDKKMGITKKKSAKARPGFEGKKRQFINKK